MSVKVIPGILTKSLDEVNSYSKQAAGVSDNLHIDIIEKSFADNETVKPEDLEGVNKHINFDYHLMVEEPESWLDRCIKGQADRVFGHIEKMSSQSEFLKTAKARGLKAGIVVDLGTELEDIVNESYHQMDAVILMSVKAGFGGQDFNEKVLEKIEEINKRKEETGLGYEVLVDGGVNSVNLPDIVSRGANSVILGNRIFQGDLAENINKLKNTLL